MKNVLPRYLLDRNCLIGTVMFSVLFALIFLNLYIPFSDTAWFGLGNSTTFLITAGFAFISILILVTSRVVMYQTGKVCKLTYAGYILWCIIEVVLICILYTVVTMDVIHPADQSWAMVFGKAMMYGSISLIIPYIMAGMYFTIMDKNRTISLMNCSSGIAGDVPSSREEDKITLFDSGGSLKLSVRTADMYYIESDDNYIKVWYLDSGGGLKTYILRCRLKTVEESFRDSPLARCHRKYIVNLDKVRVLRKEKDAYWLDLENDSIPPLPVSKTYSDAVLERFRKCSPEKVGGME